MQPPQKHPYAHLSETWLRGAIITLGMSKKGLLRCTVISLLGVITVAVIAVEVSGFRAGNPTLIERSSRPASRIFEGFAYAGQDLPNTLKSHHVNRLSPTRLPAPPLPEHFVQGHDYFFHHPLPADDGMRIAEDVLAPRLRAEDFTLTETVNGIFFRGYMTLHLIGGGDITTFGIQFRRDACTGEVWYRNDSGIRSNWWPVVRRTWDPADYVLTVKGACNL
jgi:hypothetical protein